MTLEFFLPMIPPTVTQQEHRIGKRKDGTPYIYDPPELKEVHAKFAAHLAPHRPPEPITKGVRLVVKWLFPFTPESGHYDGEWKITKPDTDNLLKAFKDEMTRLGFWKDDALVCSEINEKFWGKNPGIYVCVREIDL